MIQVIVIKTDGTRRELDRMPNPEEMKKIVDGWIELTSGRLEDGRVVQLVVNEDGFSLGLKHNPEATKIFHRNRKPEGHGDVLVGDVVMLIGCKLT